METRSVDMHVTTTRLTVQPDGAVQYKEMNEITEVGQVPNTELVDPTPEEGEPVYSNVLGAFPRNYTVMPGDPDTGNPDVEAFRTNVA